MNVGASPLPSVPDTWITMPMPTRIQRLYRSAIQPNTGAVSMYTSRKPVASVPCAALVTPNASSIAGNTGGSTYRSM
jgi:hypothetical protein